VRDAKCSYDRVTASQHENKKSSIVGLSTSPSAQSSTNSATYSNSDAKHTEKFFVEGLQIPPQVSRTHRNKVPLSFLLNMTNKWADGLAASLGTVLPVLDINELNQSVRKRLLGTGNQQAPNSDIREHTGFCGQKVYKTNDSSIALTRHLDMRPLEVVGTTVGYNALDLSPLQGLTSYRSLDPSSGHWSSHLHYGEDLDGHTIQYSNSNIGSTHQSWPQASNSGTKISRPFAPGIDQLEMRLRNLYQELKAVSQHASSSWTFDDSALDDAMQMFTASSAIKLSELYSRQWHPSCAVLHRPSFNLYSVSSPLLLSVIIMGAVFSPDIEERNIARRNIDLVECYVFQDPSWQGIYQEHVHEERDVMTVVLQTEMMLAAVNVACLQVWEGSLESRSRMRKEVFPNVVEVSFV
jgi:Fungal specific transcription factor domain